MLCRVPCRVHPGRPPHPLAVRVGATALAATLTASTAFAHLPHQAAAGVALDPDVARTGRALVALTLKSNTDARFPYVFVTTDGGRYWEQADGPDESGYLADATWGPAGPVLLGEDGRVWEGGPGAWTASAPGGAGLRVVPFRGGLAVGTAEGAALGGGGSWTFGLHETLLDLAASPDGAWLAALSPTGSAWVTADGAAWTWMAGATGARGVAVDDGGTVYVAVGEGVQRRGDGWEACGALPTTAEASDEGRNVYHLYATADGLYAATGQHLYASDDGCASWAAVATATAHLVYGSSDTVITPDAAWTGVAAAGGTFLAVGYGGVDSSTDAGATHRLARLVPADVVKMLAFGPADADGGPLYATSYGGGALRSDDGGRTWTGSASGMSAPVAFGRVLLPYGDTLLWAGDAEAAASFDGAATWAGMEHDTNASPLFPFLTAGRGAAWGVIAPSFAGQAPALARSDDGLRWSSLPADPVTDALLPGCLYALPYDGGEALILGGITTDGVALSTDGAASWARIAEASTCDFVAWPADTGARLLGFDTAGAVHLYTAATGEWTTPTAAPAPLAAWAVDRDGVVVAFDGNGGVWRSDDGGDTFAATGAVVPATPEMATATRAGAPVGAVWVGTRAGTFVSLDHGVTFVALPRVERMETFDGWFRCVTAAGNECPAVTGDAYGAGAALRIAVGSVLEIPTRHPWLVTVADRPLQALVDGVDAGEVLPGVPFAVGDGWHTVTLTADSATVVLDAVELRGEGDGIEGWPGATGDSGSADSGDSGGADSGDSGGGDSGDGDSGPGDSGDGKDAPGPCGCGSPASPTFGLALAAASLLVRRRR